MSNSPIKWASERAFTQVDLIASILVMTILAGWLGLNLTGERARIAQCRHNLRLLGQITLGYANDHGSSLPPASVQQPLSSWDVQIAPYLNPSQVKSGMDPFFLCPSDHLARPRPRSYAMNAHDMTPANWPPGPDNQTGVGLSWDRARIKQLLGDNVAESLAAQNADTLPMVKYSWLPDPANTIVLTELIDPDNLVKDGRKTTVSGPMEQMALFQNYSGNFHNGRFNYLMADGRVESLSPLQTGPLSDSSSLWSISKKP
jgi:prepilin-type processing-associated H-X9-DG protein